MDAMFHGAAAFNSDVSKSLTAISRSGRRSAGSHKPMRSLCDTRAPGEGA